MVIHVWSDFPDRLELFMDTLRLHCTPPLVEVVTSDPSVFKFDTTGMEFVDSLPYKQVFSYELAFKLLSPIDAQRRHKCNIIAIDDDIAFFDDPLPIFKDKFACKSGHDSYPYNVLAFKRWKQVMDVLGSDMDIYDYNQIKSDAGVFTVDEASADQLEDLTARVIEAWPMFDAVKSRGFKRKFDQYVLAQVIHKQGHRHTTRREYAAFINTYDKFVDRYAPKPGSRVSTMLHYGSSSHKPAYIEWVRRRLSI